MSNPVRVSRRKDAIATRTRLVRAAVELFTTDGYRATTTLEIAARASIAEATIYRHFSGKEALYNAAVKNALATGMAVVRDALGASRGGSCRDRLGRMGAALVEWAGRDAAMATMLLDQPRGAALDEANAQLAREFRDLLRQVIASGKQEGTVRPGSADLWTAVWLALVRFAVERVAAREWAPGHASIGQTLEAAWEAIAYRAGGGGSPSSGGPDAGPAPGRPAVPGEPG